MAHTIGSDSCSARPIFPRSLIIRNGRPRHVPGSVHSKHFSQTRELF